MASHLGLRSLTMSHLWDARLKWVNHCLSIYFGVFTEQTYEKPLERYIVYIPIYIEPRDVSDVKINHDSLQSDVGAVPHTAEKLRVNVLLLQI